MDPSRQQEAADKLLEAHKSRTPIDALTKLFPDIEFEDSYRIQELTYEKWLSEGRVVKGHKVGLTSVVMQKQLGVSQPDYGHLLDDCFFLENNRINVNDYISPKVEPEIAFVLKKDLKGPGVNVAEAIAAVDFVLPSLELIDSRIKDWKIGIIDTIADNASGAGVILGSKATRLDGVDLRLVGCTLIKNGQIIATGAGGAVLGSPINSLVWLANTLGRLGSALDAGQVVLPGSVTAAYPVAAGDTVTANFGPLGSVTAAFGKEN